MKQTITIILAILVLGGLFLWGYNKNENAAAPVSGATSSVTSGATSGANSGTNLGVTANTLAATENSWDFGTISMKNGDVSKDFTFTNPTDKDIIVRGLETSCMCTTAFLVAQDGSLKGPFGMPGMGMMISTNELIKAGENRTLRVVYNPNAHGPAGIGMMNRFITLTDTSGNILRFEIKAKVTP